MAGLRLPAASLVFAMVAAVSSASATAQGPVFNGVGAGDLIDFTTWNLYGDASAFTDTPGDGFTYSILSLTQPGVGSQAGAAFAPTTVMLDFNAPFTITFDFYMSPGSVLAGDGMTFVLTPHDPQTVNGGGPLVPSGGSDLGYGGTGLDGLAFAIDTFNFSGEPVAPSIQFLTGSDVTPVAFTETGLADIRDPSYIQWQATLSYAATSGLNDARGTLEGMIYNPWAGLAFSVYMQVDGSDLGLHNVPLYYGFTASNGLADDGHHVSSAIAVPEPETYALLFAGLGLVAWRVRRAARA
jgi:hypothetical protein